MLDVQNLIKQFNVRGAASVHAVDDVSFTIEPARRVFTLLGPSGVRQNDDLAMRGRAGAAAKRQDSFARPSCSTLRS